MGSLGGKPVSEQAAAAASRLRIDAATNEVLRAFDESQVRARLLKGPALADWYPPDQLPGYLDCDLWVHPDDLSACERELEQLGFRRDFDQRTLPDWWLDHAASWSRDSDATNVDVHRTLQGVGVDPRAAWEILCDSTDAVQVAGYTADRLDAAGRALYVTLHAAHHGQAWGKAIAHLERALEVVEEPVWRRAAHLAARLRATDEFAAGLHLLPQGAALASRLALPAPASVTAVLHAETPPPTALGFAQLADAEGTRERATILARKVLPPPAFIRHWWPPARRGTVMLVVGYLYRPVWLLRQARRGLPAWWHARSRTRN